MSTLHIGNGNTTLREVFTALTFGELSQYAVGGYANGEIAKADIPKVLAAINRGINQIQLDLSIHENTVRVYLREGILTYHLHSKHSMVNGTDPYLYIDDSQYAPFEDDVLRIREVFNKGGTPYPLNMRNNVDTLYVPSHNVIQHPYAKEGDILGVVYSRFTKPLVATTMTAAKRIYLPIPDYTLNALYAYVAAHMTAGITTNQEISDSQSWKQAYEGIITKLQYTPAIPENGYHNTKLPDRGWV